MNLLPIGSVVLLKDSSKKVMIIGLCQKEAGNEETLWDYSGCLFPEGYLSADKCFLFNNEQIESVYYIGFQDEEQLKFTVQVQQLVSKMRNDEDKVIPKK